MTKENPVIGKRYRLDREIGRGGMGVVYQATDLNLNRPVAIKVLPSQVAADQETFNRFRNEVFSTSRLEHPCIIRVYDAGVQGSYYYVMQYVEGTNLYKETQKRKRFLLKDGIPILRQIGSALDYAHKKGFIHRDVKPENILLDQTGNAYLVDFGIVISSYMPKRFTRGFIGTPEYASPEHCRGDELTGASDQYSFAIIAYEMFTGRPPFERGEDANPVPVIVAHLNDAPPDPRKFNTSLPEHVASALLRAISKKPLDRFQSCQEFVDILSAQTVSQSVPYLPKKRLSAEEPEVENEKASKPAKPPSPEVKPEIQPSLQDDVEHKREPLPTLSRNSFRPSSAASSASVREIPPQAVKKAEKEVRPEPPVPAQTANSFHRTESVASIDASARSASSGKGFKFAVISIIVLVSAVCLLIGLNYYSSSSYMKRGDVFYGSGNFTAAVSAYKHAIKKNEKKPEPYFKLAMAQASRKDYLEAAGNCDKVLAISQDFAKGNSVEIAAVYAACGKELADSGDSEKAIAFYEKAVEQFAGNAEYTEALAAAYKAGGHSEKALAMYEKIAAKAPSNPDSQMQLADLYMATDKPELAIEIYERLAKQGQASASAYSRIGQAYYKLQNYDMAIANLETAVEKGDSASHSILAKAYDQKGDTEKAIAAYRNALKLSPGKYEADFCAMLLSLGDSFFDKKKDAAKYYKEALTVDSKLAEKHLKTVIEKADSLFNAKNFQSALKEYSRASQFKPDDAKISYKVLLTNYKLKKNSDVLKDYDKVAKLNKNDKAVLNELKNIKIAVTPKQTAPQQPAYNQDYYGQRYYGTSSSGKKKSQPRRRPAPARPKAIPIPRIENPQRARVIEIPKSE